MRQKLVSAARCAIRMRSKESDPKKAVELLNRDLLNGPSHCFGIHSHCSTDFCLVAQEEHRSLSLRPPYPTSDEQPPPSFNLPPPTNDDQPPPTSDDQPPPPFSSNNRLPRKRKATEQAKQSRQKSKYIRLDDTHAARSAHNRDDGGISPEQVMTIFPRVNRRD